MNYETIEKATELQERIHELDWVLKIYFNEYMKGSDYSFVRKNTVTTYEIGGVRFFGRQKGEEKTFKLSNKLTKTIKKVLEEEKERLEQEYKDL